ncbi:MAG: MFS transporter [Phenylobacterium sp.]|uniref:MFS transporter n=1 Tax=Phenylobacterium sp. TaxID=1871053 RepID=UPI001A5CC259|nr:MFS transporter [Phenylobacterium sp.]MBL8770644.1 MFS transporter [Phenylobacterium sp.]
MRRLLLGACALRFLDAFVLIYPFYTVMFAERGLSAAQIGLVLAAWSLVCLVLEVPFGVLADRFSRRWLMSIAQVVRCAGFLVWLAFPNFWGFLVGLMLWGMKSATLSGAFEAAVFDDLKARGQEAEYIRVFGRTQAARFAGVVAGALGAGAAASLGYDALIWASIATGLGAAAAALALPPAPRLTAVRRGGYLAHLRRGAGEAARLPGVLGLLVFIAAMQSVVSALADYWPLFGHEVGLPKPAIGLFVAAISAVGAVAAALAHRLRDLPPRVLHGLLMLAGLAIVAAAASYRAWSVGFLMAFVGLYWIVDTNADARFQHALRPETRATVASVKGLTMQASTSVLMLSFGLLAQRSTYQWAFAAYGALLALVGAGFAAWGLLRLRRPGPL